MNSPIAHHPAAILKDARRAALILLRELKVPPKNLPKLGQYGEALLGFLEPLLRREIPIAPKLEYHRPPSLELLCLIQLAGGVHSHEISETR